VISMKSMIHFLVKLASAVTTLAASLMLQMPCFVSLPLEYQELNLTSSTTVCHSKATFLQEGGS